MKYFILAALIATAYATEDAAKADAAQFPMGGMGGMNSFMPMFGGQQQYPIDYSQSCSNSCGCARQCVPWQPCMCRCPPPCPPTCSPPCTPPGDGGDNGETPGVESPPPNRCTNGAPDEAFPDCCFNLGRGTFCCTNGANNRYCCLNGADNPWCSPTTEPPVQAPPGGDTPGGDSPGGGGCPCQCQPCIPWMPCRPCSCPCG